MKKSLEKKSTMLPHPNYQLVFEDEFDGKGLNTLEWDYRIGERLRGINLAENVKVEDGQLRIRFDRQEIKGEMRYTCGGIISKRLFGYGYYETKGKLWGGSGGLHSSFWAMGNDGGDGITAPKKNTIIEIDGYEVDSGKPASIGLNVHYYIGAHKSVGGVVGTKDYTTIDTSEETFVFGFEWLPNQINWYLNGVLIRQYKNPAFYGPQNMWLTALGCEFFDQNIDFNRLPGESNWDYFRFYTIDLLGVNLIVNAGFEYNKNKEFEREYVKSMDTPVGWYTEGENINASFVFETPEAFEGECVLKHYCEEDYSVTTKVKVPFLPMGKYTVKAMVRNPMGGNHKLRVVGFGSDEISLQIPKTEDGIWTEIKIENFEVSKGECVVAFTSRAKGFEELEIDAVSLIQTIGKAPHTSLDRFKEETAKPNLPLGQIIIHPTLDDSGYHEVGSWMKSGLSGYLKSSKYAQCQTENYAIWKPDIENTQQYDVAFFNVCYENRAKKAKLELFHKNGVEEKVITQQEESGWIEFGSFELEAGSYVKLSAIQEETIGNLAAETVKFESKETQRIRQLIEKAFLFKMDTNTSLIEGVYQKFDRTNPTIKSFKLDNTFMVPLKYTTTVLGAGTFNQDANAQNVEIFYEDYMIRFKKDSDIMNVRTKDIKMQTSCCVVGDVFYAPLTDIAQAFGKKIWNVSDKLIWVSEREVDVELKESKPTAEILEGLF